MKTLALLVALLLAVPAFGASIPGTIVAAKVTTGNDANTFSIGDSNEMNGTPKSVGTIAQRDAITMERRAVGMTCWVQDAAAEFQLQGGIQNSNWVERMTATYNYTTNFYFTYLTNMFIDNSVSNYYMTNLVYNTQISNYFTTNIAYYSYTTNEYFTNIVNNNTYISNFWETNWSVFPTYISNFFQTNYYTTITNITTNITTINFTTNVFITNLFANFFTNYYAYISNAYITNIYAQKFYAGDTYIQGGMFRFVSDWPGPTNTFTFSTNCFAYQSAVPVNVQDFVGGTNGYAGDSELLLFNGSGSNVLVYFSGTNLWSLDGTNQYILTNGDISIFGIQRISTTSLVGSNLTLLVQRWAHKLQ